jgi:spectinomycin phosphotransferase
VKDWPAGVDDGQLKRALADGWAIEVVAADYAAVGFGSYHWVIADAAGQQRFVTVDDLGEKGWLGDTRDAVFEGLEAAMDTALALRRQGALHFVVAPMETLSGATLHRLGSRHAVAVFPFLDGDSGRWGEVMSDEERAALVDMLAALHRCTPLATRASPWRVGIPGRRALEAALGELDDPWLGGPYSEPARDLVARGAQQLGRLLETFDRLADRVATAGGDLVITHGEPHPGNVVRMGAQRLLVDWDTVGLAPPERDLWMVISETGEEVRRYVEATGRAVDPDGLALYRVRWAVNDVSDFVDQVRNEHHHSPDTDHAWLSLNNTVERLIADDSWFEAR